jgi:DNA-binding NtrC family response regulator
MQTQRMETQGVPMPRYLYYYLSFSTKNRLRDKLPTLENLKSDYIGYILNVTGNNISKAAAILHISRPTIHNKLKNHHIH